MKTTGNNRSKGSNIEDKDNNLSRDSYKAEQTGEKIISRKIWKIWWVRILSVLASIVVFCTVYALILPAVAVTEEDAENGSGYYLENGEETPAVTEMAYNGSGEDAQMVNMNVDPVNDDFSGGNSVVNEAGSQDQGEEFSGSDDQNQLQATLLMPASLQLFLKMIMPFLQEIPKMTMTAIRDITKMTITAIRNITKMAITVIREMAKTML